MEAPVRVAAGTKVSSDSRVGDFSSTDVDPSDGLTFWSANEYQGSDFWDTHIASFSIAGAAPATLTTALPAPDAQPTQNPSATTALDTGPRTPSLSRSISQLARRTPPSVAQQSQPLPQSPWVASGPVRQTVTLSTVRL
jgi:hypothetical protein